MKFLESKIPPVLVVGLSAALMWLVASAAPAFDVDVPARSSIAAILAIAGALISASGVTSFGRAGTTVNPTRPGNSSSLVLSGPYRFTRNPMYLGFLLILAGWAAFLSNLFALLFVPLFALYIDRFQIAPEEAALASRFGQEFISYKARVRRWL